MDKGKVLNLDILDLCNILKTLGFVIKDVYRDKYEIDDSSVKSIQIKCNSSGIKVVLESKSSLCSCPEIEANGDNEKWEMSGTSGGIQVSKTGNESVFYKEFSKDIAQYVRKEINNIVGILHTKSINMTTPNKPQPNISMSSSHLFTSPKRHVEQIKVDTPSRYRSLDTLNDAEANSDVLPNPRKLGASQKLYLADSNTEIDKEFKFISSEKKNLSRQNTYTTSPTDSLQEPRTIPPSRTSSPVPVVPAVVILNLYQAEKLAEELLITIQESIVSSEQGACTDKSITSVMNVSKLSSIQQPACNPRARSASSTSSRSTAPFSSSPNLCRIQESSKIPQNFSGKRLSLKSPSISQHDLKTYGTKHSLPRNMALYKPISPSFSTIQNKNSVLSGQISGSYKSLSEKGPLTASSSLRSKSNSFKLPSTPPTKEEKPKKRNSLYSHIKSTIPRQCASSKK